jgi:hypothetical protein
MAYYINNANIFDIVCTEQGIELIKNKILEWEKVVNIEVRYKGTPDEVILIQTLIDTNLPDSYSNAVMLDIIPKKICVNPISNQGDWSASLELKDYIEKEITMILRNNKIDKLCQ